MNFGTEVKCMCTYALTHIWMVWSPQYQGYICGRVVPGGNSNTRGSGRRKEGGWAADA